jgi:hypothetical protein
MEVLITLSLQLFALFLSKNLATTLVKEARVITLQWITRLQGDVRNATDAAAAKAAAENAFLATLLYQRTFSIFTNTKRPVGTNNLSVFVQASLALQENLLINLDKLPCSSKRIMIRDTKITYDIQSILLRSIFDAPDGIRVAINTSWSERKVFGEWQSLSAPHSRWLVLMMADTGNNSTNSQVVHYNFIEGHLLVDGKPLGRLPHDICGSDEVRRIFSTQHLLTYQSAKVGMSYVVASRVEDNQVHFSIRGGRVIIRARTRDGLLEYIPTKQFLGTNSHAADFPHGLISNCAHWLNLDTKRLEIRRKLHWKTRPSDWIVDVLARRAVRNNRVSLVDPNSALSKEVTNLFRFFESPDKVTIFQPISATRRLSVKLRHLQLSF